MELKHCPFCGNGPATLYSTYSYKTRKYFIWAECDLCGARSKAVASSDDPVETKWEDFFCRKVAAAWNMRREPHAE